MTRQKTELRKKLGLHKVGADTISVIVKVKNNNMNFKVYKNLPNCITYPALRASGATNYYLYN